MSSETRCLSIFQLNKFDILLLYHTADMFTSLKRLESNVTVSVSVCGDAPKFLQLKKSETAKIFIVFGHFGLVFSTAEISVHQYRYNRNCQKQLIFGFG